jgi:lipopolysaccharide export system protein LptA
MSLFSLSSVAQQEASTPFTAETKLGKEPARRATQPGNRTDRNSTEIIARASEYDQRVHQAIFTGDMIVDDPDFYLTCDKLTAFLKQDKTALEPKPPVAPPNPPPGNQREKGIPKRGAGGLERAIAEGSVVIRQEKIEPDGKVIVNIGHSRKATYDAASGSLVLTGLPRVQQGLSTCIGLTEKTVITLTRDGEMRVSGDSKTVISEAIAEKR